MSEHVLSVFQTTAQVPTLNSLMMSWILSRLPSADSGDRRRSEGAPGDRGSRDRGEQQTPEAREARGKDTATGGGVGDEGEVEAVKQDEARRGGRESRCRPEAAC